jgi:ABC-type transport system involved in Fe-S cluster assembly fused permease/ATPase subunit
MQYSDREMSQLSFEHLLNLSFAFHMRRKTGELLRILDRGASINHTLEASHIGITMFGLS